MKTFQEFIAETVNMNSNQLKWLQDLTKALAPLKITKEGKFGRDVVFAGTREITKPIGDGRNTTIAISLQITINFDHMWAQQYDLVTYTIQGDVYKSKPLNSATITAIVKEVTKRLN